MWIIILKNIKLYNTLVLKKHRTCNHIYLFKIEIQIRNAYVAWSHIYKFGSIHELSNHQKDWQTDITML